MRTISPWQPHLVDTIAPTSERLIDALAADILGDRIGAGARLPAQRDLAWTLQIGVSTVTKAYRALERRGLIESIKGSGTFVINRKRPSPSMIDLSVNAPPAILSERVLSKTLSLAARKLDSLLFLSYPPPAGHDVHRSLMANWLEGMGIAANPEHLLLTNGAQQALAIAFAAVCDPGCVILTERLTHPGALILGRVGNYLLKGLATDAEGVMPEALHAYLANGSGPPTVLYITPTLHNPTTSTMGLVRRQQIVEICRHYNIQIIEDDVYGMVRSRDLPSLVQLAPERTLYVTSLSKCLCPGLRIGMLLLPPQFFRRALLSLQASGLSVSPLSCMVAEQWIADGTAEHMMSSIGSSAARRIAIARSYLAAWMTEPAGQSFHVWLPMSRSKADYLTQSMSQLGILLTPPDAVTVEATDMESGIRLCLGIPSLPELHHSLALLKMQLQQYSID